MRERDVVVIGAGQAGLAIGYYLRRVAVRFSILDAAGRIGESWASRWDSLRLFTPARYSQLPERPLDMDPWAYPGKNEIAAYLEDYASAFELPVDLNTEVQSLRREGETFTVHTNTRRTWRTRQVVVATGPFQVPLVPAVADCLDARLTQVHSSDYERPEQLPRDGAVLVVGGGNSGYQIALELAQSGREVHLSRGEHNASVPQKPLGRDIFWWQDLLGVLRIPARSALGRRMRANDSTIIGIPARVLADAGVRMHERLVDAAGRTISFSHGGTLDVTAVVWATGFRRDYSWLDVPGALDDTGTPIHERGISPVQGLYFLGLPWLHTTGSALIGFVARDAQHLARTIDRRREWC